MKVRYDEDADALYIQFWEDGEPVSKEVGEGIIVDYSEDGAILGIEILEASKRMAGKGLDEIITNGPKAAIAE